MWNCEVHLITGVIEHCIFMDEKKAHEFYERLKAEDDTQFIEYDQGAMKRTITRSKVTSFTSPQPVEQYMKNNAAVV